MLSFFAPWYLLAALATAGALVAAHFIVRRLPRAMLLPTARFVPDAPALTTGWARRPADLAPLALRVLCVLLAGLALAGPFLRQRAGATARVLLLDRSRAIADSAGARDSVAAYRADGDVVVPYGAAAERGSLSAGLVAATRAAARLRRYADSVELVIISSFAAEEIDAATALVRREWPGRARLVHVEPATSDSLRSPAIAGDPGDPLAVALALAKPLARADVRIVRGALGAADSAWTTAQRARVLLHWPASAAPEGFIARGAGEIARAAGVVARGPAVIAPFQRRWQFVPAIDRKPVAWWIDGDVAAAEAALGGGCVRSVAIPVSAAGDFALRPEFHALLRELAQPCGGAPAYEPISAGDMAMLAGTGGLAPSSSFARPPAETSPAAQWLLLASLACALLELLVRRRGAGMVADPRGEADVAAERKVA